MLTSKVTKLVKAFTVEGDRKKKNVQVTLLYDNNGKASVPYRLSLNHLIPGSLFSYVWLSLT